MKFGFLSGCLQNMSLGEKLAYAHEVGYDALDVSCWPKQNTRDYSGSDIITENLTVEGATEIKQWEQQYNVTITSLAYYDNMLIPDKELRQQYYDHLKSVIAAADMLDVPLVGCFVGKNQNESLVDNFKEFKLLFDDLCSFAKEHHVKLMIENCPMPGWQEDGLPGTISYSPESWDEMFSLVPNDNFGLNFDPSHLKWLGIDYLKAMEDYRDRIFHIDAKDIKMHPEAFYRYGIFGKKLNRQNEEDLGFWTPVAPGLGDINWSEFYDKMKELHYDDCFSVELEDRRLAGSNDDVKKGLKYSFNHLCPIINDFK